jgi:hypothetical protein
VFSLIDLPGLIERLRQANMWAVLAGFAEVCVTPFIRACAGKHPGAEVSYRKAFGATISAA